MCSDYIITVDENGEPYIAHWFGLGHRNPPRNHKYVARIETPRGVRYFYTNADLKAYYFNQRVKDKIRNLFSRKKKPGQQGSQQLTQQTHQQSTTVKPQHHDGRPTAHAKVVTGTAKPGGLRRRETISEHQLSTASGSALTESYKSAMADYEKAKKQYNDVLKIYGQAYDALIDAKNKGASQETIVELTRRRDRASSQVQTYEKEMKVAGRKVDEIEWEIKKRQRK